MSLTSTFRRSKKKTPDRFTYVDPADFMNCSQLTFPMTKPYSRATGQLESVEKVDGRANSVASALSLPSIARAGQSKRVDFVISDPGWDSSVPGSPIENIVHN